jgi:hypothetical protein
MNNFDMMKPTSSRVCELCSPREYRAMRNLESLTPSGSEFVNDPEACVAFIQDRMDSIIKVAKERNKARGEVMAVWAIVEKPFESDDKAERFDELMQRMEAIKEALR